MKKIVIALILFTMACSKPEPLDEEPLVEEPPVEEVITLIEAVGTYNVEVLRSTEQDISPLSQDTFSAVFNLESTDGIIFTMTLGDSLVMDDLTFDYETNEGIIRYSNDNPNFHLVRYIDYYPEADSLVCFSCACYLGGSTAYSWNVKH